MANVLKMAKEQAILGLLEKGWSYRRISRELSVDRGTVARYDRLRNLKPAIPTPGSGSSDESKPAISTPGSGNALPGRDSLCKPLAEEIGRKLDQGLSAQRIFQDICSEHGFTGSYSSVKRYVRRVGTSTPLPFRRMEVEPGLEAQVDFGAGAWIVNDEARRRPHIFRITLSHSRKGYSEPVFRQTTENFIRALESAFRRFGGVPKTLVIDNLRAAVKNADWFDPDLNPKIMEFARHYGIVVLPTKPRMPRHKGKVESGVKYVKDNALKGRTFTSLAQQKEFLDHWEQTVADTRIHGTTKQQVHRVFEDVERPALQPLPAESFPFYHEGRRKVHRDAHVEVDRAYYSVPPEYLGREVWVRWDARLIRIFNDRFEQITIHARMEPGKFSTNRAHLADKKIAGVERGVQYFLDKIIHIGPHAHQWAKTMLDERGIEGVRVLLGFVALTKRHKPHQIEKASRIALRANLFRLRPLRELIKRAEENPEPPFTETHEIIRPLAHYQNLISQKSVEEESS
jgi:transposase